jgi:hypothetical protein
MSESTTRIFTRKEFLTVERNSAYREVIKAEIDVKILASFPSKTITGYHEKITADKQVIQVGHTAGQMLAEREKEREANELRVDIIDELLAQMVATEVNTKGREKDE